MYQFKKFAFQFITRYLQIHWKKSWLIWTHVLNLIINFLQYNMGDYKWNTFAEVNNLAMKFGRGLRELGQRPKENMVIFAETRSEWMVAAHGLFKQNIPSRQLINNKKMKLFIKYWNTAKCFIVQLV